MSNTYNLFAGFDGTGNHRKNDTRIGDGSQTNVAKTYDLYKAKYGDENAFYGEGVGTVELTPDQIHQIKQSNGVSKLDFYNKAELAFARNTSDFDGLVPGPLRTSIIV